jgi:ribosomal protein S18 acetylase RimI-like enzyme
VSLDPVALQAYLRGTAQQGREVVDAGALLVTINRLRDLRFLNHAVPAAGADAEGVRAAEGTVRRVMSERRRLPRVEAVSGAVPGLEEVLTRAGWELESRLPLMACTPDRVRDAEAPPGLELELVRPGDDPGLVRLLQATAAESFGDDPSAIGDAEVEHWRAGEGLGVLARLYGVPVATGQITPVANGLSEVTAIATRAPYRRRGLAGAVTAACARAAFERGATTAFLSPGDEGAGRVYRRAGFEVEGEVVALVAGE